MTHTDDFYAALNEIRIESIGSVDPIRFAPTVARSLYIQYLRLCRTNFLHVADMAHLDNAEFWLLHDIVNQRIDLELREIESIFGIVFLN